MDKVWYVCFPISSYWFPSWLGLLGTEPVYLHLCAPHLDCFPAGLACEYKDEIRLVCVREGAVWIKSGKYNLWWNKLSGFIFGWQNGPAMPNIFGPCSHVFTIFFFFFQFGFNLCRLSSENKSPHWRFIWPFSRGLSENKKWDIWPGIPERWIIYIMSKIFPELEDISSLSICCCDFWLLVKDGWKSCLSQPV